MSNDVRIRVLAKGKRAYGVNNKDGPACEYLTRAREVGLTCWSSKFEFKKQRGVSSFVSFAEVSLG